MRNNKHRILILALLALAIALLIAVYRPATLPLPARVGRAPEHAAVAAPARTDGPGTRAPHDTARTLEDHARLEFQQVQARADRGDAKAQGRLAELYEKCFTVNMRRGRYLQDMDTQSRIINDPRAAQAMRAVAHRVFAQCGGIDEGQFIPMEAISLWRQQAAANGDAASQLLLRGRDQSPISAVELEALLDQAIVDGDPKAILHAGSLASRHANATSDKADGLNDLAWVIAACRYDLDCRQGSELMDSSCLNMGSCLAPDIEAAFREGVAGRQAELDREVERVLARLQQPLNRSR